MRHQSQHKRQKLTAAPPAHSTFVLDFKRQVYIARRNHNQQQLFTRQVGRRIVNAISGDGENGALSGKSKKHFIMAFIKTLEPAVKYMRGKFNKSDSTYYKQMYNHTVGVRVDNPYKGPASAAQTAVKDKFKACWTATDTELADASKHATWLAKFKKQRKYKTLRTYVFKQLYPTINI